MYSSISGRVIAEDTGKGIADVPVIIHFGETQHGVETDKNGFYIFEDLGPGTYFIGVIFIPIGEGKNYYTSVPEGIKVEVQPGKNVVNVNIVLKVGGKISGQVFYNDGITPVEHAAISIRNPDLKIFIGSGYTDENGRFFIQGIAPTNNAEVKVKVSGYYKTQKQNITITKGQTTENINFILPSTETGVSGTVIDDATNMPIENAVIVLEDSSGETVGKARTDASGKYSIVGVPPGTYGIWATRFSYQYSDTKSIVIIDKEITTHNISLTKKNSSTGNKDNNTSIFKKFAKFIRLIMVSEAEAATPPIFIKELVIDSSCKDKKKEIETAFDEALEAAKGNCLPSGIKKDLEEILENNEIRIQCKPTKFCDGSKKCGRPCGHTVEKWPLTVNFCPIQFGEGQYAGEKKCPCLKSMVLHELLHFTSQGLGKEVITYPCALKCFSCARKAIRGERVETECCSDAVKFCCTQTRINCRECPPDMSKNFDPGPHPCDYEVCPQRC